ncbi:hypothetical protein RJT34_24044 [Clitoria ternatea]|uniref:Uncharacterized protein n=1 Tax=Clitoria ternatea TaxID=43366 RepID=A0AAN9FVP6_CLITE
MSLTTVALSIPNPHPSPIPVTKGKVTPTFAPYWGWGKPPHTYTCLHLLTHCNQGFSTSNNSIENSNYTRKEVVGPYLLHVTDTVPIPSYIYYRSYLSSQLDSILTLCYC